MPHLLPILADGSPPFEAALARLAARGPGDLEAVAPAVREVLAAVRAEGDAAVRRYVERFERRSAPASLVRVAYDGAAALARLAPAVRDGLVLAAARIERFHRRQWDAELARASLPMKRTASPWGCACARSRGSASMPRGARPGTRPAS